MDGSSTQTPGTGKKSVILETHPDSGGSLLKYLLPLTPLFLIAFSVIAFMVVYGIIDTVGQPFSDALSGFLPDMGDVTSITILVTATIGNFVFFAVTGWILSFTEMWTGSVLSLGLSTMLRFIMATWLPDLSLFLDGLIQSGPWVFVPLISSNGVLSLLSWIAFLVQPFSILAVITVVVWSGKFRRSLHPHKSGG